MSQSCPTTGRCARDEQRGLFRVNVLFLIGPPYTTVEVDTPAVFRKIESPVPELKPAETDASVVVEQSNFVRDRSISPRDI